MKFTTTILLSTLAASQAWTTAPALTSKPFSSPCPTSLRSSLNDFNVVLRPSEKSSEAYDNGKIGAAKVHRYARDSDDSEAEYIMWYHGRNTNFDQENKLPPLSTGRIFRATSRNGLHWVKCKTGSASEDVDGVSLGLNKESWWGFDTAHVGLGQVLLPMSTPAVMTEGGVYLMYYMGGSFEETKIVNYLEQEIKGAEDTMIQGMNMKVGVALSQDGITFGRVEGDDPSGAIMSPYDESDPNMKYMKSMRDDDGSLLNLEEELYCAWPEVAVNDVPEDDRSDDTAQRNFYMFYSTMIKATKEKSIGVAVSDDGFRWFKRGTALRPENGQSDDGGCARCTVVRNAIFDEETNCWSNANGWFMLYEGVSSQDGKHRIMAAESTNLRDWNKIGVVLELGENEAWDSEGVGAPHLLRLDDGTTRMYYTGQGKDGSTAIGVAKCTGDLSEWTREQATVTFSEQE